MSSTTVIATNMLALTNMRNLGLQGNKQKKANQKISSGKKINTGADDAAGLSISKKMSAQIKSMEMASKNVDDTISLLETAEGSLTEVNNMLTRVRELTVQAANDTNTQEDRIKMAQEVDKLFIEIDDISTRTEFSEKKLNNGTFKDAFFQIGSNISQKLDFSIGKIDTDSLNLGSVKEVFGITEDIRAENIQPENIVVTTVSNDIIQARPSANLPIKNIGSVGSTINATFKYKVDGVLNEVNIQYKVGKDDEETALNIANALKNTKIKDKFEVNLSDNNVKLSSKQDNKGGSVVKSFEVVEFKTNNVEQEDIVPKENIEYYSVYNFEQYLQSKGATVKIYDKTYTKVDKGDTPKENEFRNLDELAALIKKDGITLEHNVPKNSVFKKLNSYGTRFMSEKVSNNGGDFSNAIDVIDDALNVVTEQRVSLGSTINRLEWTNNSLNTTEENLTSALSVLQDTDMAKEIMNLTAANVLQQSATSIFAQANQAPNNITKLLG